MIFHYGKNSEVVGISIILLIKFESEVHFGLGCIALTIQEDHGYKIRSFLNHLIMSRMSNYPVF